MSPGIVFDYRVLLILLGLTLLLLQGCRRDPEVNEASLYGKWEVVKASRNGKETQYLRGGYFIFEPSGILRLNITGAEEKGNFLINDNAIQFNEEKTFDIAYFQKDTLSLRYPASVESLFEFNLARVKD